MPVVRELINRISIQLDKGSKKNADNAFDDISKRGKNSAGSIKKAFATIGIGLSLKEVADSITEIEQNTASAKFFSRSNKEATTLLDLFSKIEKRSDLISKRESQRALATASSFAIETDTLKQLLPFLEKIQEARPGMDFDIITQRLGDVIKSGDLQALQDLIPGIKSDLELLSKSTFGKPFGDITQQQRAILTLETLVKNRERLNELAKEQSSTITIETNKLKESVSDFGTSFGEKTAPAIKDLLHEINTTLDLLNSSEKFWNTVSNAIGGISSLLSNSRDLLGSISGEKGSFSGSLSSQFNQFQDRRAKEGLTDLRTILGKVKGAVSSPFESGGTFEHGLLTPVFRPLIGLLEKLGVKGNKQEVSGEVRVVLEGRNVNGMDVKKMEQIANQVVNDRVITPIQNIRARNGDVVPNSP